MWSSRRISAMYQLLGRSTQLSCGIGPSLLPLPARISSRPSQIFLLTPFNLVISSYLNLFQQFLHKIKILIWQILIMFRGNSVWYSQKENSSYVVQRSLVNQFLLVYNLKMSINTVVKKALSTNVNRKFKITGNSFR